MDGSLQLRDRRGRAFGAPFAGGSPSPHGTPGAVERATAAGSGCRLNVDPVAGAVALLPLDSVGSATVSLLPDYPTALIGNAYMRWAHVDNDKLLTTRGQLVRIRQ